MTSTTYYVPLDGGSTLFVHTVMAVGARSVVYKAVRDVLTGTPRWTKTSLSTRGRIMDVLSEVLSNRLDRTGARRQTHRRLS